LASNAALQNPINSTAREQREIFTFKCPNSVLNIVNKQTG
jgi:hypothetical protein